MSAYGQFCPVAKAMELLDERWTLLVVRELLAGSTPLQRPATRQPPDVAGPAVEAAADAGAGRCRAPRRVEGGRTSYTLTACGEELRPAVDALGAWGTRWIGELGEEDLDPHLLMWDMRRTMPLSAWPRRRTVLAIEFDDVEPRVPPAGGWSSTATRPTSATTDPGFDVTATVGASLRTLTEVWRGDRSWPEVLRGGLVKITGPASVVRDVPRWLGQGSLAHVPRPA